MGQGERQQLYWEDVAVGQEIPGFSLTIDALRIALQASGSQDFYAIHYDRDFARAGGLRDIVVNTGFTKAALCRLLTDWIGAEGWLKRLKFEMRKPNEPGDIMTCKGKVTAKYIKDGQHLVDCQVWVENQREGVTTPATATVLLPSRGPQG